MGSMKKGVLVLEDGTYFEGIGFGSTKETFGEVVFNTSMVGYQKALTDPSYNGQILTMTFPLIGNYGTADWMESSRIQAEGLIVDENCLKPSHRAGKKTIDEFLREYKIPGLSGVDTRAITRKLREHGVMNGILKVGTYSINSLLKKVKKIPAIGEYDLVKEVTTKKVQTYYPEKTEKCHVVILDCGVKLDIIRYLLEQKAKVTVIPAKTTAEKILDLKPDGFIVSPGPGDPVVVDYVIETVKEIIQKLPTLGICLGHQIIGLASGAKTYKLKFGHRGSNQPVMDLEKNYVIITAQNHGYAVDEKSLGPDWKVTHINLNDKTVEGMRHKKLPVFSVQYHPEAGPGPYDSNYLFNEFVKMIE
jgi:carbamoyl-phosphate synthase small subunit